MYTETELDQEPGADMEMDLEVEPIDYSYHGKPPILSAKSISTYFKTRLITLKPPSWEKQKHLINPVPPLMLISQKQWAFIFVAFAGWTWDAFDFFTVSLTAVEIATTFDRPVHDITWGITLVLMLRSVGAVAFGLAGDKWGRKWPFIVNCLLFTILELGTGFTQTYTQFLAVRALFGIAMGGIYGNAAATALDDCPIEARGIVSGLLQQGYAFGYLLCVIFNRVITFNSPHGWRALFWFGAAPPVLIIVARLMLPETDTFLAQKHVEKKSLNRGFIQLSKEAARTYWLVFIFLVVFMAGMNFMSHGSQDLFPTFLTFQLRFSADRSTVTNSVANIGAMVGGIFVGHISQFIGRRLSVMVCCVVGSALIYPWSFVHDTSINAAVFFLQFAVQGAWGVVPIYISELSPPHFRSFIVGLAYQLGNLASSASSTIESTMGEKFPILDSEGEEIFDYGKVMAIFMGCVFGFLLIISFVGPERRSAHSFTPVSDPVAAILQMKADRDKERRLYVGEDLMQEMAPTQSIRSTSREHWITPT